MNAAIRQHWAIENQLQLNVLKNEKSKKRQSMKVKRHRAGWDNDYVFQLLNTAKHL